MLFRNFIRKEEADDYLSQGKALQWQKGKTVDTSKKYQSKRVVETISLLYRSNGAIVNHFPELIRKVYDTIAPINARTNKFDIDSIKEMNMLKYGVGGKYDWHQDVIYKHPKERKFTFIIQLSDSNEYEGGDLEFYENNLGHNPDECREKGSMIVFSSFLYHRITPLTKGNRYSIVGWVFGPPWK